MARLALMEQGVTLGADGEIFVIQREREVIERVRMADVDQVLVFGSITLTPATIAVLLRRGIDTVFLTARGRYRGRLVGAFTRNVDRRIAQFERLREPATALDLARRIVGGKIVNQRNLLLRVQRQQRVADLADASGAMRNALSALTATQTLDQVRGLEGQASAAYFGALGLCIRNPAFSLKTRRRRPPRDPVNAMLSFGYTMLATVMESAVLRAGLDPMLGALHEAEFGRPSLVLDLIEEFRPVLVDALMLRLVNRREVGREDFEEFVAEPGDQLDEHSEVASGEPAVWLGPTGRKIFFRAWGARLRETHLYEPRAQTLTFEQILRQQVYHLARVLTGDNPVFVPFVVR